MATKPRGGGLKALVTGPLRKELFFAASLIFFLFFIFKFQLNFEFLDTLGIIQLIVSVLISCIIRFFIMSTVSRNVKLSSK